MRSQAGWVSEARGREVIGPAGYGLSVAQCDRGGRDFRLD